MAAILAPHIGGNRNGVVITSVAQAFPLRLLSY